MDIELPSTNCAMDIAAFAQNHGLDKSAEAALQKLPHDVLQEVFSSFRSENSDNPSARLVSFVKKMVPGHTHSVVDSGRGRSDLHSRLTEFNGRWSLDEKAESYLEACSPAVQEYIMNKFNPDTATQNVNATMMSFIRVAKAAVGERQPIPQMPVQSFRRVTFESTPRGAILDTVELAYFVRKYKLDSEASATLLEMPNEIRCSVMETFSPPPDADYSKLFTSFALSRWKGSKKPHVIRDTPIGAGAAPTRKRARNTDRMDAFVRRWRMDKESVATLENLPRDVAEIVMDDFSPPGDTENVNRLFVAFARRQGTRGQHDRAPRERPAVHHGRDVDAERWANQVGLDDKAKDLLFTLNSNAQAEVISQFHPPEGGNVNKIFMAFAGRVRISRH
eukprot:GEMP01022220.1.p1 GENE.GEMP01022220.1~~GEMP01022220.1.p1  ORF type:complete len:406 (+),score=95.08 GEMP01022220.1:45-1220(+)